MPAWELAVDVDVPPDEAWALVGDPASVPRWYPKYVSVEVDGDSRLLRSAEGAELRERLLERDDAARSYSYSVLSGAPVRSHRAGLAVSPREGGSRIAWWTEVEPTDPSADIEGRLTPTQTAALRRMKQILEGAGGS